MKYIIDIPDDKEYAYVNEEKTFLRMPISLGESEVKSISVPTLLRMMPYAEPDRKAIEDEIWKFYQTISNMKIYEQESAFDTSSWWSVINKHSYQEAKTKYNEWLRKNHDGCKGCKYDYKSSGEEPCFSCKQNYLDKWEATE